MVQIVPVAEPGILFIAGETVMLEEPDSIESEILLDSDIAVPFEPYYIPTTMTDEERTILEDTMQLLFSNLSKDKIPTAKVAEATQVEVVSTPFPPCGKLERDLVVRSLIHRRTVLRDQLSKQGVESAEDLKKELAEAGTSSYSQALRKEQVKANVTLGVKVNAWHFLKLTNLITEFEKNEFCIDMGDLAYLDQELDLSDEQLERLVKQFVFFVLQTKTPLKKYVEDASGAIPVLRTLGRNPLDARFPEFLQQYRNTPGTSIPAIISRILDDTRLDKDAMKKEIDKAIEEAKRTCLDDFKNLVPEFIKSNPNASGSEIANEVMTQLAEMQKKLKACESEKTTLLTKKQECDTELAALKEKLQRTEDQVKSLDLISKDIPGLQTTIQEGKDEITKLKAQIKSLTEERDGIVGGLAERDTLIRDLKVRVRTNEETIAELNARIAELQRQSAASLADLQRQHTEELAAEQRRHDAALADQTSRHQEEVSLLTDARDAADSAKRVAEDSLEAIAAEVERATAQLSELRAALATAQSTVAENAATIGELERQVTAKEGERAAAQESLNAATTRIGELEPLLAGKTSELGAATAKVAALEQQVLNLTTENTALKAALQAAKEEAAAAQAAAKACEAELNALKSTASASQKTLADLQGEIAKLQTEKGALELAAAASANEIQRLQGLVNTLTSEKQKAEGERDTVRSTLAESTGRLAREETAKLGAMKQVETLEGKVQGLEKDKKLLTSETASKGRSLEEVTRQKATIQSDYDKAFGQVKSLAEWISDKSRREATDPDTIVDVPDSDKLQTLNKLREGLISMKESKHILPIGEISSIFDTKTYTCIAVYFTTYTWLIHMPYLIDEKETEDQRTSNLIRSILYLTLSGGSYKERTTTQKVNGLYYDLSTRYGEFPELKEKEGVAPKYVLDVMIKLKESFKDYFQARQDKTNQSSLDKEILTQKEKLILQILLEHLTKILKAFDMTTLRQTVEVYFKSKAPQVKGELLDLYYSLGANKILSASAKEAPNELLAYPIVWYLFLFVLRDSLNKTKTSSEVLCPLPPLMDQTRNPDHTDIQ